MEKRVECPNNLELERAQQSSHLFFSAFEGRFFVLWLTCSFLLLPFFCQDAFSLMPGECEDSCEVFQGKGAVDDNILQEGKQDAFSLTLGESKDSYQDKEAVDDNILQECEGDSCHPTPRENSSIAREYSLEARVAYFYPTNSRFRDFYSGGAIYGLEFNAQIWKRFFVWGEVDYFSKSGHTRIDFGPPTNGSLSCCLKNCKEERTRVTLVPCSVGLKYYFNHNPVQFYLGAGVLASYLHTHVHSQTLVSGRGKWGWGGAFKSGLLCHISPSFLIDFFADYQLVEVHLHRSHDKKVIVHHADLSGFSFGGALGYLF